MRILTSDICETLVRDMRNAIRYTNLLRIIASSNNLSFITDKSSYTIKYSTTNNNLFLGHYDYITDGKECEFNIGKYISDIDIGWLELFHIDHQYSHSITQNKSDLILCTLKSPTHYTDTTLVCITIKSHDRQYDLYIDTNPYIALDEITNLSKE